ncbi:glycoside hydrolase [Aureobasidium subglaciale]|nr:glycoside hydrolase [Aureobasidium subglaciale]
MHIVVDLHGVPGGQNGLDNQGKAGRLTWWNNQTSFDLSIEMRQLHHLIDQRASSSHYYFGQTQDSIVYLNKYYVAAPIEVRKRSKTLPVAISDGFVGPQTWDPYRTEFDPYIVIDTHIYFSVGGSYSYDAAYGACYFAKSYQNASNPTFIDEWSL